MKRCKVCYGDRGHDSHHGYYKRGMCIGCYRLGWQRFDATVDYDIHNGGVTYQDCINQANEGIYSWVQVANIMKYGPMPNEQD